MSMSTPVVLNEKVLPLPPMIPIYTTVVANPNITISTTSSSGNNTAGGAVIVNKTNKPIPPPPPLSCMKDMKVTPSPLLESSNNSSSNYHHKPRNFLPKSLAAKPKVSSSSSSGNVNSGSGGNGSIGRDKEPNCYSEDLGAANNSSGLYLTKIKNLMIYLDIFLIVFFLLQTLRSIPSDT